MESSPVGEELNMFFVGTMPFSVSLVILASLRPPAAHALALSALKDAPWLLH